MSDRPEQLAIIRHPTYGMNDRGQVWLSFSVYTSDSCAADLGFPQPQADEIIRQANVADVQQLDGRACWVRVEDGLMRFIRMATM